MGRVSSAAWPPYVLPVDHNLQQVRDTASVVPFAKNCLTLKLLCCHQEKTACRSDFFSSATYLTNAGGDFNEGEIRGLLGSLGSLEGLRRACQLESYLADSLYGLHYQ